MVIMIRVCGCCLKKLIGLLVMFICISKVLIEFEKGLNSVIYEKVMVIMGVIYGNR